MDKLFQKMRKKLGILLCFTLLLNLVSAFVDTDEVYADAAELKLNVESAILIDAASGQVLYDFNSNVARPPASMSKMMTEYILLQKIKQGSIKWTDQVTITKHAADSIGSGQLLAEGETYTVEQMFKNMSIYSGNDASIAVAEHISGTEENFAKLMNKTADKLGLSDKANFINATGLSRSDMGDYAPKSISGETMLTASDAAKIAYNIVNGHPEALKYTSMTKEYLRPGDETSLMTNYNWMLEGWIKYNNNFSPLAYQGLDGLKTGYTDEAGYCFTGTAQRNGMRLISVVMGTASERKRFEETRKLMDYGFNQFEKKKVFTAKTEIRSLKKVNIKKGVQTQVDLVTQKGVEFVVKKGTTAKEFKLKTATIDKSKLVAPIKKGDVLGSVTVSYGNVQKKVNLVASEDVEKASWIRLLFRGIKNFFKDIFSGIKNLF